MSFLKEKNPQETNYFTPQTNLQCHTTHSSNALSEHNSYKSNLLSIVQQKLFILENNKHLFHYHI